MAKKALKKLMRDSYNGCIDDPEYITDILNRFSELTLGDVVDMVDEENGERMFLIAEVVLNEKYELGLKKETIKEFGFLELLFMIDNTGQSTNNRHIIDDYNYCEIDRREPIRYASMNLVIYLFGEARKINDLFRLFSAVSIKVLFDGLQKKDRIRRRNGKTEEKSFRRLRKEFYIMVDMLKIEINHNSSIGDICRQADRIRRDYWNPFSSLEAYESTILCAWEIFDCLLIDCFRYAYPEKFSMDYIWGKYDSWFKNSQIKVVDIGIDIEIETGE